MSLAVQEAFETIRLDHSPSMLVQLGRLMPPKTSATTVNLLRLAFKHGGYIAGGFARIMARINLLGEPKSLDDRDHRSTIEKYLILGHGDIDVWFPSRSHYDALMADSTMKAILEGSDVDTCESLGNIATEVFIKDDDKYPRDIKVQLIRKFVGEQRDRLSTFDIFNAMVAFDDDTITVPKGWHDLERNMMLHVNAWHETGTLVRVCKYIHVHRFYAVTPDTASALMKLLEDAIDDVTLAKKNINGDSFTVDSTVNLMKGCQTFVHALGAVLPSLSNDQLLFLSGLGGVDQYNKALNLLCKRSLVNVPIVSA